MIRENFEDVYHRFTLPATGDNYGLIRFAENGESAHDKAVRADDSRLNAAKRGYSRSENISTREGYMGSESNIQSVINNQIIQLLSIGVSTGSQQAQINSIVTSSNASNNADNWSTYPATNSVNMNGYAIHSSSDIRANYFYGNGLNVTNVDSDKLDGQHGAYYLDLSTYSTGILPIEHGGTNNSAFDNWGFLTYDGTRILSTFTVVSIATSGHTHLLNDLVGTLNIAHGGTNNNTFTTSGGLIYWNNTNLANLDTYGFFNNNIGIGTTLPYYKMVIYSTYTHALELRREWDGAVGGVNRSFINFHAGTAGIEGDYGRISSGFRSNSVVDGTMIFSVGDNPLMVDIAFFELSGFNLCKSSFTMPGFNVVNGAGVFSTSLAVGANSVLTTNTDFSGDVSGKYNSTAVADDSHNHTDATISNDITIDSTKYVRASSFTSTIAIGTPPLQVVSTTKVANLNADTVDGYHIVLGSHPYVTIAGGGGAIDLTVTYSGFTSTPTVTMSFRGATGSYNNTDLYTQNTGDLTTSIILSVTNRDTNPISGYIEWSAIGN